MPTLETLRKSLEKTASDAKDMFLATTTPKTREVFLSRGQLGDEGTGAVYAYFDADGRAVYVGETGRRIKSRMHDETSPHAKAAWWPSWTAMRFLRVSDRTDRLTLELLLILALEPPFNAKPGARVFAEMFASAD
ncbi:MAG: hypothetical protein V4645_22735 [Pseudomonadota bacterium]